MRKSNLVNLSTLANELGVKPQSVTRMVQIGKIEVVEVRGREKYVDLKRAKKAIKAAAIRQRDGSAPPTMLIASTVAKLKSELALRRERLERARARYTDAEAEVEGGRALLGALLPRIVLDDTLIDRVMAAGDAARVRGVLSTWARDVLRAAASDLKVRAAELNAAPVTPVDEDAAKSIVGLRAAVAEVETKQRNLRLAVLREEVVDREQSLAKSEEVGRRVRARVEQIANASVELVDAARVSQEAVRARFVAALSAIAADVRAMLAPTGSDEAAA